VTDRGAQPEFVACVGHTALDYVFTVNADDLPKGSAKLRASDFFESGGGMAANAAAAIVRLGGRARFCGPVGDDPAGERMTQELASTGVDVSGTQRVRGASSSLSTVIVNRRGERLIVGHRGSALESRADPAMSSKIANAAALLADVRWPDGALSALSAARARGCPTVLDADVSDRTVLERLAALAEHVVFSELGIAAFAPELSVKEGLRRALGYGAQIAAVTRGERGVYWMSADAPEVRYLPAYRVEPVDTTGAGDVFHGAYVLAIAEGQPPEEALHFACAAAALKCTRRGARSAPTRAEVVELMLTRSGCSWP
jgi:sulfofructose kinase